MGASRDGAASDAPATSANAVAQIGIRIITLVPLQIVILANLLPLLQQLRTVELLLRHHRALSDSSRVNEPQVRTDVLNDEVEKVMRFFLELVLPFLGRAGVSLADADGQFADLPLVRDVISVLRGRHASRRDQNRVLRLRWF